MLTKNMIKKLNHQINLEFYSSNLYLQMSAWCENKALEKCALFLREHALEEMAHMQKLFDYVLKTGALPIIGKIDAPVADFKSIHDVFNQTLVHEKFITNEINELAHTAFSEKDFSTFNFLQWYVAEQHEEESLFNNILDRINLLGEDNNNLYFLDKTVGEILNKTKTIANK